MRRFEREYPEAHGGCQCGAVRFSVSAGTADFGLCHCRMCQRATGNAFAPLFQVPRGRVAWVGEPKEWASSNLAWRGFCSNCGTPLYYRDSETVELMAGCFSPDFRPDPQFETGDESRLSWLDHMTDRPRFDTGAAPVSGLVSYQSPED